MKTSKYHCTNLGSFAPTEYANNQGYITIHESSRYSSATGAQLAEWLGSRSRPVAAAAATELAKRKLSAWRKNNN